MLTGFGMGPCQESTRTSRQVVTGQREKRDGWLQGGLALQQRQLQYNDSCTGNIEEVFGLRPVIQRSEVAEIQALTRQVAAEVAVTASYLISIMK